MGHQNDELVPVVTVALSITADIPGGHVSPKDSSRLGNSTEAKTVICNEATPKHKTCSAGRTFPDLQRPPELLESSRDTEQSTDLLTSRLLLLLGVFPLPFHPLIFS